MKLRWGEAAGALLTFLVFVALPIAAQYFIPTQILEQFSATGLNVQTLAREIATIGIIISVIALAKAFVERTSITYLILNISSNIVSLAFALLVVGVGNISSLGYSSFNLKQGKVTTEILLDLRVFIYLTIGVVAVSVLQTIARFREARAEAKHTPPN